MFYPLSLSEYHVAVNAIKKSFTLVLLVYLGVTLTHGLISIRQELAEEEKISLL